MSEVVKAVAKLSKEVADLRVEKETCQHDPAPAPPASTQTPAPAAPTSAASQGKPAWEDKDRVNGLKKAGFQF